MRTGVLLLALALAAVVLPACARGRTSAARTGVTTVSYGSDRAQVADLWLPEGPGPHPVVVLVHGGFWQAQYGKDLMDALAADLRDNGVAAWNIEYRRVGNGGGWPATFDDVGAALDALAEQADPHALDLDRVAVAGHSAGGQLALWLGARKSRVKLDLVVGLAPVTDLVGAAGQPRTAGVVRDLLGGSPGAVPDRYDAVSPLALAPIAARLLVVESDGDGLVPPAGNADFLAAQRDAGAPLEHLTFPGDHFDLIDPKSAAWRAVRARLP